MQTTFRASAQFDVVIVGAGCAGISAAIGLAKAGFRVAVVEAAVYPGAENWSGCVYFCENLAHPELLGPEGVADLAWERRLVQRGTFIGNGQSLLGVTYRDPEAFRHCYTVLRPVFDHHLGLLAQKQGVVLLNQTTAESLIRDGQRVVGVATNRGPLYGDLVFLAEGDASHLVSREGYEQLPGGQKQPKFLHGIKQILDLPPEAIDRNFGLRPGEGAACEIILRNATLHGKALKLNMGGFIYTNHASLSIGLVLPADHLHEHFAGDPNLLIEWFENLPDLKPWFREGTRGVFGAKLIRGGGARELPRLVDDGLAIGGAASGVGVDFPYPNYTGPATRMGLELVRAVKAIRGKKANFTAQELRRHYLEPLRATRYWQDVEFLRDWPEYVESTRVFFDQQVDVLLGSAYVLSRPGGTGKKKWRQAADLVLSQLHGAQASAFRNDQKHLAKALPVSQAFTPPPLPLLLVDGVLNMARDWLGKGRQGTPQSGELKLHYTVLGDTAGVAPPPAELQQVFRRIQPGLAAAAREIYLNDDTPLPKKVHAALRGLARQLHLGSLLLAGMATAKEGLRLLNLLRGKEVPAPQLDEETRQLIGAATPVPDLTPLVPQAAQKWEDRLGQLGYLTDPRSHIHLRYPVTLSGEKAIAEAGLWHVCPAHVYEARVSPLGQLQLVVNYENCIKCETCWRTSDLVDWGRDGNHRFIYAVQSPAMAKLITTQEAAPVRPPVEPFAVDVWAGPAQVLARGLERDRVNGAPGADAACIARLRELGRRLAGKVREFSCSLAAEPRTIDTPRADYLLLLARYCQRLGLALREELRQSGWQASAHPVLKTAEAELGKLTQELQDRLTKMVEQTAAGKFAWAAAEGRQVEQHHLAGLNVLLETLGSPWPLPPQPSAPTPWLRAEAAEQQVAADRAQVRARLDDVWGPYLWRDLDQGAKLTPSQEAALKAVAGSVPAFDPARPGETLHPPLRKMLLAELARRDASLGYRVARHLLARDLATACGLNLVDPDRWLAFVVLDNPSATGNQVSGTASFIPAADEYLILAGDRLFRASQEALAAHLIPQPSLGLRGAGLHELKLEGFPLPADALGGAARHEPLCRVLESADLIALALGMGQLWTERCVAHAASRVQFPGLFHDERSRDTIGKFGAVKKMLAEMAAATQVIETLAQVHSPRDASPATACRLGLLKGVVAELLGTAPGSLGYNAGQVFGGTGYSEDDILSKAFRDSAAWRFLGGANSGLFLRHGEALQEPTVPDGFAAETAILGQRQALEPMLRRLEEVAKQLSDRLNGPRSPAAAEQAGRLDAFLYAGRTLLLRLHARHEEGLGSEELHALAEVFFVQLQRWADEWLDAGDASGEVSDGKVSAFTPETDYLRFIKTPIKPLPAGMAADDPAARKALAFATGDFLTTPIDLRLPRYVPEMIETDATLKATDEKFHRLMVDQFGSPRDGMRFERYIEARHLPDAADLDFCRQHGFFRMPIAPALGGEGKLKAEYYSLVMQLNQFADATMSLLVQANTSIGTSPLLLARDKDLPKAVKELKPFVHDDALHSQVSLLLKALADRVAGGDVAGSQATLKELEPKVEPVLKSPTLKGQISALADVWKAVSRGVATGDLKRAAKKAEGLLAAWEAAVAAAKDLYAELLLRQKACDLGLRWIASGQISAFALTEPSAGSDTARVATRATPCSVLVEEGPAGTFRFTPRGGAASRLLLDAERLEFKPDGVYYRCQDGQPAAKIEFDEYDYETDDPRAMRYFRHAGQKVAFTDVAYLRQRDGRRWYDYWELTGAKMWITNGRMSGIMALYAKTGQGVTGFIVDRHAEGLVVGKDEAKMGQNGSPTNELALQGVRVPRENVLGLEGRGQVNALETLNVGRAGLAMTSVSQMRTLPEIAASGLSDPSSWRHSRIAEDTFLAEALAFYVIGLFEHPSTQSVRIESAVAKALVSELLHASIERTEELLGLAGQTRRLLVEKRKRDARIINLYEGTNEIQRFLIIKELVTDVLPNWKSPTPRLTEDGWSVRLAGTLEEFRQRLVSAQQALGGGLWQNPNLQPTVFLLSEAAMWLLAANAAAGRLAWLRGRGQPVPVAGEAGFRRCLAEVGRRLRWFDAEWAGVRGGRYAPVIRAADLLFDAQAHAQEGSARPGSTIDSPLSLLVLLEPSAARVPKPFVREGSLLEAWWSLTPADEAVLEQALRLRDAAPDRVAVTAVVAGGRGVELLLREVAARQVRTLRVELPAAGVSASQTAAALAEVLRGRSFDLLLGPAPEGDVGEGLLTPLVAAALNVPYHGTARGLAVRRTAAERSLLLVAEEGGTKTRPLGGAVGVCEGTPLRPYSTAGYLAALSQPAGSVPWPAQVTVAPMAWRSTQAATRADTAGSAPRPLDVPAAAELLLGQLGVQDADTDRGGQRPVALEAGSGRPRFEEVRALAVVACDTAGRLSGSALAAVRAAGLGKDAVRILLLAPAQSEAWSAAARQLGRAGAAEVDVLAHEALGEGDALRAKVLLEAWPLGLPLPRLVTGERWAELAFPQLRQRMESLGHLALRVKRLVRREEILEIETSRAGGKLAVVERQPLTPRGTLWLTLTDDAEVAGAAAVSSEPLPVRVWTGQLDRLLGQPDFAQLLEELKAAAGVTRLQDAEFILDVGYGVGNRDGYEAVIEPLEAALRHLGVRGLMVGGSRKVTEELHILPIDRQIGQSGVSVNPRILIAIGISGAPQHLQYIGPRATILCFNKDPEAPMMTLNQRQARPRVFPVVGDLFSTVPAFIQALRTHREPAVTEVIAAQPTLELTTETR